MFDRIPLPAKLFGLAGVVPFAVAAIEIAAGRKLLLGPGPALYSVQIYGAVILSFLGGVHWGLALASDGTQVTAVVWRRYGMSVVPAAVAWAGVWFAGQNGLLILAAGFLALLAYDIWCVRQGEAPAWYQTLRLMLSALVVALLLIAALFGPF